jgi:microcystin-dependent protein
MLPGMDAKPLKRPTLKLAERAKATLPAGVYMPYGGSAAPIGYLLCNGQAVSRAAYPDLFVAIGTTWGAGDGSTTFNVPNIVDRLPMGAGNLYAAAATGGSKDAVAVSHSHTASSVVTDPGHRHTMAGNVVSFGSSGSVMVEGASGAATNFATTDVTVATTVDSAGVSGTNANLPPYLATHWIIKT